MQILTQGCERLQNNAHITAEALALPGIFSIRLKYKLSALTYTYFQILPSYPFKLFLNL